LRYSVAQFETAYNLGDPRSAYYISGLQQAAATYAKRPSGGGNAAPGNSAWWGRIYQWNIIEGTPPSGWVDAQTLVSNWPDGDHTTVHGLLPLDTTVDPLSVAGSHPATEANKAPVFISNSGSYNSITELGHIYDPIQWRPSTFTPSFNSPPGSASASDVATNWKAAWKNDMVADPHYGDASTLRIGSPEFKQFDKDGSRAAQLMDLFCVADRADTRGLVNVNTASRDVLRALGAGIKLQNDAAIVPTSVFGPMNSAQADKFADAVIACRPFLTTSQLAGLRTDPNDATTKFFGNADQWSASKPTEWNDSAREEYFSRMFNLTTVRSRNFRIFVTGQSLDKNGNVLSTVNRVFEAFLQPSRDTTTGKITNQHIQITYESIL
jgi:hypothetical protein